MLTGIDHLVVVVPDLEDAERRYRTLGFTVVPGGRHAAGTHNALVGFEDGSYLELIAFREPYPAHRWWPFAERGSGLADVCVRTNDFTGDVAAIRAAGLDLDGPRPLTRTRPDGVYLRWTLAVPPARYVGVAPFLIEDETPREARVPPPATHANGVVGIDTVTIAVDDVPAVRRWYAGPSGQPAEPVTRASAGGAGVRIRFGPHAVEFLAPVDDRGALTDRRRTHGPSPYLATLRAPGGRPGRLDPALTLGAPLALV